VRPGSPSQNTKEAYERGQKKPTKRERNGRARLNQQKAREIKALYAEGATQKEISVLYGVSQKTISNAIHGLWDNHEEDY
jgi:DNA-binding NarL/FixJ family response regulator